MKRVGILSAIVVAAFASSAHAQAPTQLYACVNNSSGTIKMVAAGTVCSEGATLFTWNVAGPQGMIGPQGPTGPAGPQGLPGAPGVIGFSEYTCNGLISTNDTPLNFTFDGITGGAGVGGNSLVPVNSFVLQPGIYQFQFKTLTLNGAGGIAEVILKRIGAVTQFAIAPLSGGAIGTASGTKLVAVTSSNTSFSLNGIYLDTNNNTLSFSDCSLSILQLQ
jgi:hypothetical protein